MKNIMKSFLVFVFFNTFITAQPIQKYADIGDLVLTSGDTLFDCRIGYRVSGQFNDDSSNVIIYPSWFGGTTEYMVNLIGPDKLIDNSNHCIILIDALANGVSISPSNSEKQPGEKFPEVSIRDMVESEYLLLTKTLKLEHVYGAIGGSMGSMQVFEWLIAYPDFIDKALPYVPTPQLSSYDRLRVKLLLQIINKGKNAGMNELEILQIMNMETALTGRTPEYIHENIKREDFENYLNEFEIDKKPLFDIENRKRQLQAMYTHDIYRNTLGIKQDIVKTIKAEIFMIISATDHILYPEPALEFARLYECDYLLLENNCGHLAIGCEMERCAKVIKKFFK